ncbi:MAG: leucyl/phenylalanyl-tRNA--protein transferase [Pirellulales bacterium]|nr:leucyl/phenylalanyl-tRNA--protein transferase [Pirellulales bacterium]
MTPALSPSRYFPPAQQANRWGLVLVGGELSTEWLLDAYRHGIFPWPLLENCDEVQWWSPNPRAIFEFEGFHISRRLARRIRSGKFAVTSDRDFAGVIRGCASVGDRTGNTWLSDEMIAAYENLHRSGHAHSVEVWQDEDLVGGTYGVSIGGLFAAESMFFRERDASKVALASLIGHLQRQGFQLLDIQQLTDHTASLGAVEISRSRYLHRLTLAVNLQVSFGRLDADVQSL